MQTRQVQRRSRPCVPGRAHARSARRRGETYTSRTRAVSPAQSKPRHSSKQPARTGSRVRVRTADAAPTTRPHAHDGTRTATAAKGAPARRGWARLPPPPTTTRRAARTARTTPSTARRTRAAHQLPDPSHCTWPVSLHRPTHRQGRLSGAACLATHQLTGPPCAWPVRLHSLIHH